MMKKNRKTTISQTHHHAPHHPHDKPLVPAAGGVLVAASALMKFKIEELNIG